MPVEDKQIQVWAMPANHRSRVVFGARSMGAGQGFVEWNFWYHEKDGFSLFHGSIHDALDDWSVLGEGSLWHDVEVVAAPAVIAAKYVNQDRAAWHYDQYWWWSNSGTGEGQVGLPLRNVARADAIENLRRYLQNPHSRHFPT